MKNRTLKARAAYVIIAIFFSQRIFSQTQDTSGSGMRYIEVKDISSHSKNQQKQFTDTINQGKKIVEFPDIYYEYRIEKLNRQSPIKLDYNQDVRKYINLYILQRPEKVAEFLGLKELYFPVFEEYLDKYNLPLELKYLPIVESGLNPFARSSSGAMGLWQLLLNSSKLLGLEITSYKDERCDLYLSTDAACRYLKYLFSIFNDWQLALAAYNGGPGEVRKAIKRSGGKTTFWQIQPYLSEQTKWYVPAFIAIVYLANHATEHGISPKKPAYDFNSVDTLMIHEAAEFSKISEKTGISIDTLRLLNPCYRRDYIPDADKPQSLVLPSGKILTFLKLENQIYSRTNDTLNYLNFLSASGDTAGLNKIYYTVTNGDFLHKIAMHYSCTLENLRAWNKLQNDHLVAGQKLVLWVKGETSGYIDNSTKLKQENKQHYFYYTVKKGDTMWSIASHFKCDSVNSIKEVNNLKNDHDLKPGQKLKILVKEE